MDGEGRKEGGGRRSGGGKAFCKGRFSSSVAGVCGSRRARCSRAEEDLLGGGSTLPADALGLVGGDGVCMCSALPAE